MESNVKVGGFRVFSFLKGKNLAIRSKVELRARLVEDWGSLSLKEREKYESIARECLAPTDHIDHLYLTQTSQLSHLLRQAAHSLTSSQRCLQSSPTSSFPVNLPLDDILTCPVCSGHYDWGAGTPVCLPCGHTVCVGCVGRLGGVGGVKCPMDRKQATGEGADMRPNLQMLKAASESLEFAQCKKHIAQIVAFDTENNELLCGICLGEKSRTNAILLDSQKAVTLAGKRLETNRNRLNEAAFLLQSLYFSQYRLQILTESLAHLSTPQSSLKDLIRKLTRLSQSLSSYIEVFQAQFYQNSRTISTAESLTMWQRLIMELVEVPSKKPEMEEMLRYGEQWCETMKTS